MGRSSKTNSRPTAGQADRPEVDLSRVDAPLPGMVAQRGKTARAASRGDDLPETSVDVPAWSPDAAPAAATVTAPNGAAEATPSMAQYLEIKTANPDSILWYRMGDFYELFFEDAVVAARALGIVLTKRGKHLGQDIPMCGVPIHRADDYLQKLIKLGFRVAVCEQLEDPAEARKRGAKAVVKRDVVRLVTPGTLTEDSLLDAKARNYLTALFIAPVSAGAGAKSSKGKTASAGEPSTPTVPLDAVVGLASVEISTGEFEVGEVNAADLPGELMRLAPSEVLLPDAWAAAPDLSAWLKACGASATPQAAPLFDSMSGERLLKSRLGIGDLAGVGQFSRPQLAAVAALLKYIDLTQIGKAGVLRRPKITRATGASAGAAGAGAILVIDAATRSSLEIVRTASGERATSLLGAVDRTVTAAGARELAARLSSPLADARAINARLDALQYLADDYVLRDAIRDDLRGAPDISRAVGRLAFGRGGPRDLSAVRDGLSAARAAAGRLSAKSEPIGLPGDLAAVASGLSGVSEALISALASALVEDPPPVRRDGGFVRSGARDDLDAARRLRDDSRNVIASMETRYAQDTGVKSLKIKHNNILGYFIEVSQLASAPLQKPPHDQVFRHRQTMANAMRFTTDELVRTEGEIAAACERALGIEQEVFAELSTMIAREERGLGDAAAALAELDCIAGLAELAREQNYVRPVVDNSTAFDIRGGRHPVVEQALAAALSGAFIENDCLLGRAPSREAAATGDVGTRYGPGFDEGRDARIWLVTGPNMAGKSTFLRQNALIALLAQAGSFVPARVAHIGVVDRLFSRVGASDDLARGRSTFMVEMVETAAILNQASARSLVILDEIGRGTATFDGLSIAWATVEFLHDSAKCRALFATHYHELTALAGRLPAVSNVTMDVKDWQDEIVFLHKVKPGAADRSYGIQVAKLAGLPDGVIARAREVLTQLEKSDRKRGGSALLDDLPLFAAARPASFVPPSANIADTTRPGALPAPAAPAPPQQPPKPSPVEQAVAALDPDNLSPKAALEELYRLKGLTRR